MASEAFVRGMIEGCELKLKRLAWFEFIERIRTKSVMWACRVILAEK